MPILVNCKFDEDLVKLSHYHPDIIFPILYIWMTKGQVTIVNNPISLKIKLVKDIKPILITSKSKEESIKNEIAIVRTTF